MSKNYNKNYQLIKEEKERIDLAEAIANAIGLGFLIYVFVQLSSLF